MTRSEALAGSDVQVSDKESVVEGEYDRPGVSGLRLSVNHCDITEIGESCNPHGSLPVGNFED
jgi:hypothetical protein